MIGETGGERFRIQDYLPLIFAELRLERFVKTDRFGGNHVHERAALHAGEEGRVDDLGEFFLAHHDAAARTAQAFVRSRGDELRMRNWTGMLAGRHQSGNVRHVDEKNRADRIGNLPEPGKIESARISGRAGGNHRGPHLFGQFLQRVVIF